MVKKLFDCYSQPYSNNIYKDLNYISCLPYYATTVILKIVLSIKIKI